MPAPESMMDCVVASKITGVQLRVCVFRDTDFDEEDDDVCFLIETCENGYWLDAAETAVDGIQAQRIRDFLIVWQSAERTPGSFVSSLALRTYSDEALWLTGYKHPHDPLQDAVKITITALVEINPARWVVMAEADLSAAAAEQLRQFLLAWYPLEPVANPAQLALELPSCA